MSCRSTAGRSRRGCMRRIRRRASCRASGRLDHFDLGDEGRIETGVEEGDAISPFYDPMIAKLVAQRRRPASEAIGELADDPRRGRGLAGPDQCRRSCSTHCCSRNSSSAKLDTGFIERYLDELVPDAEPDDAIWRGAAADRASAQDEDEAPLRRVSRLPPQCADADWRRARRQELRSGSTDDGDIAAVSGFGDEERVVVFYEGMLTSSTSRRAEAGRATACPTARSPRRCPAKSQRSRFRKEKRLRKDNVCSHWKR